MQRNLWEARDSVRLTSSECQAAWLPVRGVCSRSYGARNRGKHSAIFAKDPSHGGRKKEKKIRTETWIKLSIKPEEIKLSPNDVLTKLTEEKGNLRATMEEKAADLYHKMRQKIAHSWKDFTDVGKKQQCKHLAQIQ